MSACESCGGRAHDASLKYHRLPAPSGKICMEIRAPATASTAPGYGRTGLEFDMHDAIWRLIPGASFYEASSDGQIRSIERDITDTWRGNPRIRHCPSIVLKQHPAPRTGHMEVSITFDDRPSTKARVHVLVCRAFHGLAPSPRHEVRHLNGISNDNRSENLRWGTRTENALDRVRHGNHLYANQTECTSGHSLDDENTSIYMKNGRPVRRCRQCLRERAAKERRENPDVVRERGRRSERKNPRDPELRRQQTREWRARNRDEINARRRARRRSAQ